MPDEPSDAPPAAQEQLLKEFLRQRDVSCPVCGYNLRGSESQRCAECGAALDLRVGSIDLRIAPWLTALLACALPLGLHLFVAIVGTVEWWIHGFTGYDVLFFVYAIVMAIAFGFVVGSLVRFRRALWKLPAHIQWRIAIGCCAFVAAAVGGLVLLSTLL